MLESHFNKVVVLQFSKFLGTPIFTERVLWLLLHFKKQKPKTIKYKNKKFNIEKFRSILLNKLIYEKSCSKRFGFGTKEEADEDRRQETVYLLRKRTDFGPEAVVLKSSVKKVFFEVLQNSQESTCTRVSFLQNTFVGWFVALLLNKEDDFVPEEPVRSTIIQGNTTYEELLIF